MIFPSLILNIERWKYNKEYEVYVSNLGHFKDKKKKNLPVKINQDGYCAIKTSVGLKRAHRLVLLTWKPISNAEELTIDHLDHNKRNNSLKNLEWVSEEENLERAKKDFINLKTEIPPKYEPIHRYALNGIIYNSEEEIWNALIKIYPSGYPKKALHSAIKDLDKGRNQTGAKKLGKSAILTIIK